MCLGGFFGYEPTFCIFDGYFYMGGFGSPVTHLLLIPSFQTGNPCPMLLAILPTAAAAGDND